MEARVETMNVKRVTSVSMETDVTDSRRVTRGVSKDTVATIQPQQLAGMIQCKSDKFLIIDSRTFCEYNSSHILGSVNVWSSKIRKKRLQQNSISVLDYLHQATQLSLEESCTNEVVVYDQNSVDYSFVPTDSFLYVLLLKLVPSFDKVYLLSGGFLKFQSLYPELCEDCGQKASPLTSFSQPCLPVTKSGPTKILSFLFLGSQHDANNRQLLMEHNISYELNVSTSCPKPDFLQDSHFMRIPVNDNFSEKLLPYFAEAFRFIDKVREAGGRVLVHCLAGISRSPTVAIAFIMKHLRIHYDEAYRYVKHRRPTISPNINFVGQLLELDRQLLGEGVLYRSPTAPLYFEQDFDMVPSPDCLILRSSSSPSVESLRESSEVPLKRSVPPSARLNPDLLYSHLPPSSPSSALESLSLFSCLKGEREYVSERLPSSPVTPSPSSPLEGFFTEDERHSSKSARLSSPSAPCSVTDIVNRTTTASSGKRSLFSCKYSSSSIDDTSTNCSVTKVTNNYRENYSTTASINVKSAKTDSDSKMKPVCILEVTHDTAPVTYVDIGDAKPMIVHETQVIAIPTTQEESTNESIKNIDLAEINLQKSPESINTSDILVPSTQHPLQKVAPSLSNPNPLSKCESKPLPRCYSSSETHLNTRKLLESQSDSVVNPEVANAKKSFSTNEVSRGYQMTCQSPSAIVCNKDILSTPTSELARCNKIPLLHKCWTPTSELARCDSWSTSGLGSEISDLESIQDDALSVLTDDTVGPFDAVFADVFPGEMQDLTFKDSSNKKISIASCSHEPKRSKSLIETKQQNNILRQAKRHSNPNERQHRSVRTTLSLNATPSSPTKEDSSCSSATPRPISLPGVTGTYFTNVEKPGSNSNIDMGVDMEESPSWHDEKIEEFFKFSHPKKEHLSPSIPEHSFYRHRLLREDNEQIDKQRFLRFYERLSHSNEEEVLDAKVKPPSSTSNNSMDNYDQIYTPTSFPTSTKSVNIPKNSNVRMDEETVDFSADSKDRKHTLEDKWRSWDHEYKKMIRNIENNVSLSSWDSDVANNSSEKNNSRTGSALAQELMQSMEDLLETEISDIKRQTSALSSKFGLNLHPSKPSEGFKSSVDFPQGIIDPTRHKSTISFCPTLQQGIVRSAKSQNLSKTSWEFPVFGSKTKTEKKSLNLISTAKVTRSDNLEVVKLPTTRTDPDLVSFVKAKSEPPLYIKEGLYRVRSCPGIQSGGEDDKDHSTDSGVRLRSNKTSANKQSNRYSCGALDFVPHTLPTFESCPDITKLKSPFYESSSVASCSSSARSSYNRLLQVS